MEPKTRDGSGNFYVPYGGAREMFFAQDPEILIEGAAGTGKSRAVLEKLHRLANLYSGARLLMLRKTRQSLTQSVMVTFKTKVLSPTGPVHFHSTQQEFQYPNGSIIAVGGMDNWVKLMSSEWDVIYVAEATEITEEDCEALNTRLRNGRMPYQQLIMDCNPGAPTHWLNRRANLGKCRRILSRHTDNPSVTPQYLQVLDNLTGVRRLRLRDGKWAQAEGLVYEEFDRAVHLVKRAAYPNPEWTKYRVIDFGFSHAFVCQWWQVDPDGRLIMYRELYGTRMLVEDWAKLINQYSRKPTPPWIKTQNPDEIYAATIVDHDAEDRATLEKYLECDTVPAKKEVGPGIQAVKARLRVLKDGKPRIMFMNDARINPPDEVLRAAGKPTSTIEEFDTYVWSKSSDGLATEKPVKADDDGMDCVRYMVFYLDGKSNKDDSEFTREFTPVVVGDRPQYEGGYFQPYPTGSFRNLTKYDPYQS